jgi:signal transduction histidine kinase
VPASHIEAVGRRVAEAELAEPVVNAWRSDLDSVLRSAARPGCDEFPQPPSTGDQCETPPAAREATSAGRGRLDHLVWLVPVVAAATVVLLLIDHLRHGLDPWVLAAVITMLVAGHLLVLSRARRQRAEREATRIRGELALRARVADCESRRLRLAAFSRLAAQIAHEVRNPLASIVLNTELLEEEIATDGQGDDEMRALVRSIKNEAARLQGLTDEYVAFARLPEPDRTTQPINPIVAELVQFVQGEASRGHVEVNLQLAAGEPRAHIDARQVRQLILNLVRNGIDAMPDGGVLRVATALEPGAVVITVRDTGPGIRPEHREQVFEPFFSTKPHGTGIGLAIVRRIVQEHDGTIDVTSEGGACFRVRLPLAQVRGAVDDLVAPSRVELAAAGAHS